MDEHQNVGDEGVTIGDLFLMIWKQKLIVIIVAFAALIIGFLAVNFVYNPSKIVYSSTIEYKVPSLEDGKYVDGSVFDYRNIISEEATIALAKDDSSFTNIDYEKMFKNDEISIVPNMVEDGDTKKQAGYIISVSGKYFKNEEQGHRFLKYLSESVIIKSEEAIKKQDFSFYLNNSEKSQLLDYKIELLASQGQYISDYYDQLIEKFGNVTLSSNVDLLTKKSLLTKYLYENDISLLEREANEAGYVMDTGFEIAALESKLKDVDKQIEDNELRIESLRTEIAKLMEIYGSFTGLIESFELFNNRIAELTLENSNLKIERNIIDKKIKSAIVAPIEFTTKVDRLTENLVTFTENFKNDYQEIYLLNNNVYYSNTAGYTVSGGFSPIIGAIMVGVMCSFIACGVIIVVSFHEKNKKENLNLSKE